LPCDRRHPLAKAFARSLFRTSDSNTDLHWLARWNIATAWTGWRTSCQASSERRQAAPKGTPLKRSSLRWSWYCLTNLCLFPTPGRHDWIRRRYWTSNKIVALRRASKCRLRRAWRDTRDTQHADEKHFAGCSDHPVLSLRLILTVTYWSVDYCCTDTNSAQQHLQRTRRGYRDLQRSK